MRRTLITLTALLGLGLGLGTAACTGPEPAPKITLAPEPTPADTQPTTDGGTGEQPPGDREFTKQSFDIAWAAYTEDQRYTMCTALMLGTDGATDFYADGVPDQGLVDWPYFTELVQAECDAR
ncbi:hypothetical protein [Streptomyces sp. NPDC058665]|uniref:hypothetical protein n=1 Tax=Streptomyces sp. NPDC058665 TaxID=3346586 RepID=UPI00365F8F12